MARILTPIDRVFMGAVVCLMIVIVVTISADVVGRYGFQHSILFANELSRLCFIWLAFLVMPLGISKGLHVAITTLETNIPPKVFQVIFRLFTIAVIILMVVVLIGAVVSVRARSGEQLNTLPFSAAWFFVPLVLGSAHSILHLANEFIKGVRTARPALDLG